MLYINLKKITSKYYLGHNEIKVVLWKLTIFKTFDENYA